MIPNDMPALVKARPEPGLWAERRPIPDIGPEDVLIRINKTGLCGTDLHIWNWDAWSQRTVPLGLITGHEFAGEIVDLGAQVAASYPDLTLGARVSGEGHLVGRSSRASRAGRFHLDPETKGIGVNAPGAFAGYLALPAFNAVLLPDSVPDEIGAILDPLGNAVHTALSFDLIGEDVLITGAGPIGIMAAAVARHAGARNVVITDIDPRRLALAAEVADCRPVDVTREDLRDVMHGLKLREGFDIGLEMSGAPAGFAQMVETLVMGGRIAMLGVPPGDATVDWSRIIFKGLTIKGIYGREIFETWYKMLAMLENGLDVSKVITNRLPASEFATGFAAMKNGAGKVVLDWTEPW